MFACQGSSVNGDSIRFGNRCLFGREERNKEIEMTTKLGRALAGGGGEMRHVHSPAAKWSSTKTHIGSATSADLKDFSSGWPKNSAESPRFHVDRDWTSRGHGRKRG
jgi:hypothetical protein